MKLSAKRAAQVAELSTLVKAVHGPHALVSPYNLGVQIEGTGAHNCRPWESLAGDVEWYRSRVTDAIDNGATHIADIRATAEAKVAMIRASEAREVAAMEARIERCRALLEVTK